MFRGTEKYSQDAVQRRPQADGRRLQRLHHRRPDRLPHRRAGERSCATMMDMESDRFQNLKYTEDAFRTEALAVLGEYNKERLEPHRSRCTRSCATSPSRSTPTSTPRIGFVADIKAMPGYYDYSLQFFNRFYRPENATLLVVGDVKPRAGLRRWPRSTTATGRRATRRRPSSAEPPQTEREDGRTSTGRTRPDPYLLVGYHMPGLLDRPGRLGGPRPDRRAPVQRVGAALPGAGGQEAVGGLRPGRSERQPRSRRCSSSSRG